MHTKSVIFLLLSLGLLLSASCKKVPIICPDTLTRSCSGKYETRSEVYEGEIYKGNILSCTFGMAYILSNEYICTNPLVNPHNPFEFIYLRRQQDVQGPYSRDLCLYNFCDNSVKVLTQNVAYSLDWSVDNWIIFTGQDLQLWKVKSDGSQLTQLTNTGNFNNHARWSPDGTKYLYYDADLGTGKMRISHADGTLDRVLEIYMYTWIWLNNDELLYSTPEIVNKYNLNDESITMIVSLPGQGVSYMNEKENNLFITTSVGFYEFNMLNSHLSLIDSSYQSYSGLFVHPISDNYLLLERTITDTVDFQECEVHQTKYISLYNRNTQEEKWIKLPQ